MSEFPVGTFKEAAEHLRRPFTPGAVKFKVQHGSPPAPGMIIAYIDSRLVVERLNHVIPHLWFDEYERAGKNVICRLTVDGITREDVGQVGAEGEGRADSLKSGYSDALKRAAVKFGVGVSLYAMKQIWVKGGENPQDLTIKTRRNKQVYEIGPDCDNYLRGLYEGWLELERGGKQFGLPLDHGDAPEGSVGELADAVPEQPEAEQQEFFDANKAAQQKGEIEDLWGAVKGNGSRGLTKAALNAQVKGAENSNADLQKIIAHLREKAGLPA